MNPLHLFNTTGPLFGPVILLAGIAALLLCLRASIGASSPRTLRTAVVGSLAPFAVGVCAALFGLALWLTSGPAAADRSAPWLALGQACLAGLVVTSVPLLWSLWLSRPRRGIA